MAQGPAAPPLHSAGPRRLAHPPQCCYLYKPPVCGCCHLLPHRLQLSTWLFSPSQRTLAAMSCLLGSLGSSHPAA